MIIAKDNPDYHRPMCTKELARAIGRNREFISYMKLDGFPMPNGMSTPAEAELWLFMHPNPRRRRTCTLRHTTSH